VVVNEIHSGTHAIFIGQVTDVRCGNGPALTYQRGAFTGALPAESMPRTHGAIPKRY
jgi:hypothetical protein